MELPADDAAKNSATGQTCKFFSLSKLKRVQAKTVLPQHGPLSEFSVTLRRVPEPNGLTHELDLIARCL